MTALQRLADIRPERTPRSVDEEDFDVDTTCGFNRTFFANWSTHITGVQPLN